MKYCLLGICFGEYNIVDFFSCFVKGGAQWTASLSKCFNVDEYATLLVFLANSKWNKKSWTQNRVLTRKTTFQKWKIKQTKDEAKKHHGVTLKKKQFDYIHLDLFSIRWLWEFSYWRVWSLFSLKLLSDVKKQKHCHHCDDKSIPPDVNPNNLSEEQQNTFFSTPWSWPIENEYLTEEIIHGSDLNSCITPTWKRT